MRALLQRVTHAKVCVAGECVGEIERGLLVLLGLDKGDDQAAVQRMLDKLLAAFVLQQRMKISGKDYDPCYVIK